jgi:hypothetical protein
LLLVFGAGFTSGSEGQRHKLIILVDSVSNKNGVVGVLVFNAPLGGPNDNARAFRAVAVPAFRGSVTQFRAAKLVVVLPTDDKPPVPAA